MTRRRTFAIVPAAGHSRRMGQAKLLLPWSDGTVIDSVLRAWTTSVVDHTCIVVRAQDHALQDQCRAWPVDLVLASPDPEDMKASLLQGLAFVAARFSPVGDDAWITAPADVPQLTPELIDPVVHASHSGRIVAARYGHRSGHPVRLPWDLHGRLATLGAKQGLNDLLHSADIDFVDFPAENRPQDVDTWREYQSLRNQLPPSNSSAARATHTTDGLAFAGHWYTADMNQPQPDPIPRGQVRALAEQVIASARFPQLATIDGDQPRVRPVSPVRTDGFTVFIANLRSYHKTQELAANSRVELCYLDDKHDQVRITGIAHEVRDTGVLQSIWDENPLLRQYLGSIDNPELIVYRVDPSRVRFMREWALAYHDVPLDDDGQAECEN